MAAALSEIDILICCSMSKTRRHSCCRLSPISVRVPFPRRKPTTNFEHKGPSRSANPSRHDVWLAVSEYTAASDAELLFGPKAYA